MNERKGSIERAALANPILPGDEVRRLNYAARNAVEAYAQGHDEACQSALFVAAQALYWLVERERDAEQGGERDGR